MRSRSLAVSVAAAAALSFAGCVDSERPTASAADANRDASPELDTGPDLDPGPELDTGACPPLTCSGSRVPTDSDGDGCPDACEGQACEGDCDCPQPSPEESSEVCPAEGWLGYGLYSACIGGTCEWACGAIPTPVIHCGASGTCSGSPECAPWEVPLLNPTTKCVERCDTRCDLDCDCYAALGTPDDTCDGAKKSVWRCSDDHVCVPDCDGALTQTFPDCHDNHAQDCDTSGECGDGVLDFRNYCAHPPGLCGADKGTCTKVTTTEEDCSGVKKDPVCGCDDKIYDNTCLARAAKVSVLGPASMCPMPLR